MPDQLLKWKLISEVRRAAGTQHLARAVGAHPPTTGGLLSTGRIGLATLDRWARALRLRWHVALVDQETYDQLEEVLGRDPAAGGPAE